LASIAGENVFLLGPPGTAKSLVCRRVKYAFENAVSFEYLLNQFSTPDEIFGPLSIQKLKDEGKYERLTEGFLPCADIVFLDEIWKAGSAIANSLLTAINEKIFRNGAKIEKLPLKLLVSASNETPKKDAGLDALWDRFLVRIPVANIQDNETFKTLLDMPEAAAEEICVPEKITPAELAEWRNSINKIKLNTYLLDFFVHLREAVSKRNAETGGTKPPLYISDRRWRKIARLVKTAAFLDGKPTPDLSDCFIAVRCLWGTKEEIREASELVRSVILESGIVPAQSIEDIRAGLYALKTEIGDALVSISDERRIVPITKNNYYFFTGADGNRHYIRKDDYLALTASEKEITLYKQISSKTGYLNHARHALFKSGHTSFIQNNEDIELLFAPERTAAAFVPSNAGLNIEPTKAGAEAGGFALTIDGENITLETEITGHIYRVTRAPLPEEKQRWEGRLRALSEFTASLAERIADYQLRCPTLPGIWTAPEDATLITAHISTSANELEKIKLEIEEARNSFCSMKDERIVTG
jgi:MoxR-like ATPase